MFKRSWRAGRIAGVEIRIDASWAIVVVLITGSLYAHFTGFYTGLGRPRGAALALGAAGLFFSSVLIHELAHALVARQRGMEVESITLFLFGGATNARSESRGPGDEFLVAAVGPLASVALAGSFGVVALAATPLSIPFRGMLAYVAIVNAVLAVFNLLPGFPLDGGRILRSALWRASGNLVSATRIASVIGSGFGLVMMVGGLGLVVGTDAVIGGIWFAGIGLFLMHAARSSYEQVRVREMLARVPAAEVVHRVDSAIPAEATLEEAAAGFAGSDDPLFTVRDDGRAVGLVTPDRLRRFPQELWGAHEVREAMVVLDGQPVVDPTEPMDRVVIRLEQADEVVVAKDDDPIGVITTEDLARWARSNGVSRR